MISINKAILHTMDETTQMYFCAEEEMLLDVSVCEYLIKHVEKIMTLNNAQKGKFKLSSKLFAKMKEYQSENFIEVTRFIANTWFATYVEALRFCNMNLLFVEFREEDTTYFGAMQFKNKNGYIRNISREDGIIKNEILTYASLLPSLSQSVDEFFIINMDDYSILLKEDKRYLNSEEELLISDQILYCDIEMSMKDSLKVINEIVNKVSDELEEDGLDNTLKVKRLMKSCIETDQKLDIHDICPVAFPNNEQFEEKFTTLAMESKLPKQINLEAKTPTGIRRHKIKTDAGVEIIIPVDYAESKDTFNIVNNSDGTVSIELNHIGKILK
ncbi:MAG: nucleoid-associated protein [Bacilli bacterium]|nr:nucleoid-associated protein [Bacilli bacterium]